MAARRFSEAERARLHAAAEAVRARTAARFEIAVAPVSDRYLLYPVAFGAFAALVTGGLLALFVPAMSLRLGIVCEAAAFGLLSLALEWAPLKLLLVPRRLRHQRAREFAHRAFAARILAAHERRPGMVVFLSLGERYIELVTDDELDRHIDQAAWNRIVAAYTAAARRGNLADALEDAITACGVELAQHFPA
jgi:putative membrane protein